jgi:NAD(P)-dependent dehydrogenase (short-subunit alcohol dehydrogenase family)
MEIAGQAAIVSGGASGLGRATAEALTGAGVKVTILDINEASAVAATREIGGFAIGCDVTDAAAVEAAVAAARQQHGPARIAVNCAGVGTPGRIVGRDGPLPLDAFRRVIEVNLIGSFNLLRVAAAEMTTSIRWPRANAASLSRPLRSRPMKARSGRRPTAPRKAASSH